MGENITLTIKQKISSNFNLPSKHSQLENVSSESVFVEVLQPIWHAEK